MREERANKYKIFIEMMRIERANKWLGLKTQSAGLCDLEKLLLSQRMYVHKYTQRYKLQRLKIVHTNIHKNTKSRRMYIVRTQIYTKIQNCKDSTHKYTQKYKITKMAHTNTHKNTKLQRGTRKQIKRVYKKTQKKLQRENKKRDADCHESGHKNTNASAEILIIDHPYCMNETFAICMTMVQ